MKTNNSKPFLIQNISLALVMNQMWSCFLTRGFTTTCSQVKHSHRNTLNAACAWKRLSVNPTVTANGRIMCSQTQEHIKTDHLGLCRAVQ